MLGRAAESGRGLRTTKRKNIGKDNSPATKPQLQRPNVNENIKSARLARGRKKEKTEDIGGF